MIAAIVFVVFVCVGKWIPVKYRGVCIYAVTLGLLYAVTAQGLNVVGTDVAGELYTSREVAQHGWDLGLDDTNNTSWVVAWLVPVLGIQPELVYKFVLPLALAGVPVVLYMMFKRLVDDDKALYSVMFFISVPVMQAEIVMIGKSMVAELLMAVVFLLAMVGGNKWVKFTAMLVVGVIAAWAHYSIGFLLVMYLVCIGGYLLVRRNKDGVLYLAVGGVMAASMWFYYNAVSGGQIVTIITDIARKMLFATGKFNGQISSPLHLLGIVLGADFFTVGWLGKGFRVVQYATQALVLLGSWLVVRSKMKDEYKAGVLVSLGVLVLCIAAPPFASILNVTRFYHVTLFFLAPTLVISADWLYRKVKHV